MIQLHGCTELAAVTTILLTVNINFVGSFAQHVPLAVVQVSLFLCRTCWPAFYFVLIV